MSKEYIGREEAILAVRHAWAKGLEPTQYIEQIPAADVAPVVHGRKIEDEGIGGFFICVLCAANVCRMVRTTAPTAGRKWIRRNNNGQVHHHRSSYWCGIVFVVGAYMRIGVRITV
jgi:hypothetical protein